MTPRLDGGVGIVVPSCTPFLAVSDSPHKECENANLNVKVQKM